MFCECRPQNHQTNLLVCLYICTYPRIRTDLVRTKTVFGLISEILSGTKEIWREVTSLCKHLQLIWIFSVIVVTCFSIIRLKLFNILLHPGCVPCEPFNILLRNTLMSNNNNFLRFFRYKLTMFLVDYILTDAS